VALSPFDGAEFFPRRPEERNVYSSLNLWGEHLEPGETVRAVLEQRSGTLLLTNRRLLELQLHMDEFGFWNVLQFGGYEKTVDLPLKDAALEGREEHGGVASYSINLRHGGGAFTLHLEAWRDLTPSHIERFIALLEEVVGGR
jgi:hypothetical protein